jgi:hypothetical protein
MVPQSPSAADADAKRQAEEEKARQALLDAAEAAAKAASDAQARVRAALDALERERKTAADLARVAALARAKANPQKDDDSKHDDTLDDIDAYEAAVVANLHAQAVGVQDIRTLVPIVLDPLSPHYDRWRDLLVLERYALKSHVLSDVALADISAWRRMDAVVLSWIFGAVTTELMESVRTRVGTARHAWLGIEAQFLGNREFRALHLDGRFRIFA